MRKLADGLDYMGTWRREWDVPSPGALCQARQRHPMRFSCQVAVVNLLSGCGGQVDAGGECGGFVVFLAGDQAVVQAAEQAAEQVALGGGVPVAGVLARGRSGRGRRVRRSARRTPRGSPRRRAGCS